MEFANLLDMLEKRVSSLLEEVTVLRQVAEEAEKLRAENSSLREQLESERQVRGAVADRIEVLVEMLDEHVADTESDVSTDEDSDQAPENSASNEASAGTEGAETKPEGPVLYQY